MPAVVVRPRARIDLGAIWDFIAQDSVTHADAFIDGLNKKFKLLAQRPELGPVRVDLMPDLRSFPYQRYVIFYRPIHSGVEVVRVLHTARNVEAQLFPK
ncbi:type II toxin-antitoxin system RelE/ParE family toxin [Massilia antarctica]|uniref:type II toxin-antitoxin system RelE/ParE family toxin n=1 Tax=Massilia antarctica TaxID=2765360 RepID=UPI0009EAC11D|nr:type II toxin-antitoxin system RelE/ParE family toxin [Massilia sp. H27-R4]MCY0910819.1 type II toxin-antitoxin system RelE/ParE family toxin [Massilia sp. H27-R4]